MNGEIISYLIAHIVTETSPITKLSPTHQINILNMCNSSELTFFIPNSWSVDSDKHFPHVDKKNAGFMVCKACSFYCK